MAYRFHKHYTREQARRLLPQLRQWLQQLNQLRSDLDKQEQHLQSLLAPGRDLGGPIVNTWVRALADIQAVLLQFYQREIQIKDLERGLLDFPAVLDGREVFLCWEKSESDIEFWHDLETGFAGRQPLEPE